MKMALFSLYCEMEVEGLWALRGLLGKCQRPGRRTVKLTSDGGTRAVKWKWQGSKPKSCLTLVSVWS